MTVSSVDSIRNLPAAALVVTEIFWHFGLAFFSFYYPVPLFQDGFPLSLTKEFMGG